MKINKKIIEYNSILIKMKPNISDDLDFSLND